MMLLMCLRQKCIYHNYQLTKCKHKHNPYDIMFHVSMYIFAQLLLADNNFDCLCVVAVIYVPSYIKLYWKVHLKNERYIVT